MKKIITIIYILFIVQINGQTRRGLFLHGYDSNGAAWDLTGTPSTLQSEGVFNYVQTPDLPALNRLNDSLGIVLNPLFSNTQNDDWIFIGHSLGGMVAKYLEAQTRDGNTVVTDLNNLEGVLTLGSPFQGAPVADVVGNNAQNVINDFRDDIRDGPVWQTTTSAGLNAYVNDILDFLLSSVGTNSIELYVEFSNMLESLHNDLTQKITKATGEEGVANANDYIGDNGTFINTLNSIQAVSPHLSISGVEDWPASIRFASTLEDVTGGYFSNEVQAVDLFNEVISGYDTATNLHGNLRDALNMIAVVLFVKAGAGCVPCLIAAIAALNAANVHNDGYINWKRGENALNDIDNRWANLHNGDILTVHGTRQQRYWADCGTGSPPGGWDLEGSVEELELLFDLPGCSDPDAIANGGFWAYRLVSYTTHVADKSDGFIPVNRTRWKESDPIVSRGNTSSNGANIVSGNIYFDGHDEADGGYNHSELRNLTRNYGQQDASMPMTYGRQWIRTRLDLD